ncbi:MAG: mismatch repair protein [Acidobacteriaceae bacterium]|nr:mismatch repair protein [Acidobacteriaceae bacterium]
MDPLEQYAARRHRWQETERVLQRQFVRIGNARLAVAVIAALVAWLAYGKHAVTPWALLVPIVAFAALFVHHQGILRKRDTSSRAVRYYEAGIERIHDRWMGHGPAGNEFCHKDHVYAEDLDVFGNGSLFELVCRSRTAAGAAALANWFLSPASFDEATARQHAVRELASRVDLREDFALLGKDDRVEIHSHAIEKWAAAPRIFFPPLLRIAAVAFSAAALTVTIAFFAGLVRLSAVAAVLGCNFIFIYALRSRVERVLGTLGLKAQHLRTLSLLVQRLESETFQSARPQQLRAALNVTGIAASKRVAQLLRWMDLAESGEHVLVRGVLRPLLLWQEHIAMGIEAWRTENAALLCGCVAAIAEFEALSSLASLAFERPHWNFPALISDPEALFAAKKLQHPLMPSAKCVPNSVSIGGELRVLIISGSNMSGKSTLLRAVGLNTVLAWAGAPVAAAEMQISRLHVGASIRVIDSLQDNRSRFFAEITRIRQIIDLTKQHSVLFLLDELLSGTNSHDRRIGASAIVRNLVQASAIGLITTHDLALADIERDLGARAANAHFEDVMIDSRIEFDYRLRPGVVARSNALDLMRAVGLEV